MKHFTQFLLAVLVALVCNLSVGAHDFSAEYNGKRIYYNKLTDNTCSVTFSGAFAGQTDCYYGDIVIPASVEYGGVAYTVTSISSNAFKESKRLISIVIPNTVTEINSTAFYNCI